MSFVVICNRLQIAVHYLSNFFIVILPLCLMRFNILKNTLTQLRNGTLISCVFMRPYFFFMQDEKQERATLKGECHVDIQVREPLAVAKPGHRRGFLT